MAAQLIGNRGRVVAYSPSLRAMVKHFRAFSSYDERKPQDDAPIGLDSQILDWPDPMLGPLGAQAVRFPMPGMSAPSSHLQPNPSGAPGGGVMTGPMELPDLLTTPIATDRHAIILEQYLNAANEGVEDLEDFIMDGPQSAMDALECKAMTCPQLLRKDFQSLFPEHNLLEGPLTVITISQKTNNDMSGWSPEIEEERDELLDHFVAGAQDICESLSRAGYWADFIDPSSGRPYLGAYTNSTMFETDERYRQLGFEIDDLGCCKVISHHLWGTHAYVGCLFTNAPPDHPVLVNMVNKKDWDES